MFRSVAALLLSFLSAASVGQMMGSPITTTGYFPLVDGARYDYIYTSGAWSTATTVVHVGQTWAGASGLTAMHTTYTCVPGASCAPDATDFYRMDGDGMHYYGGTGANSTGTEFSMMTYTSPEWPLKNPVTPGMMTGSGYVGMETWQTNVMGAGSMMAGQSHMSSYQALATEAVITPAGTFANALHVREQRGAANTRDVWYAPGVGVVKMNDGTSAAVLTGYTIPGPAAPTNTIAPLAFTPVTGLWWNPAESGSGYNIQVQHGTLVVTVYSYTSGGEPIWYLVVGPLTNAGGGVMATGSLDKYRGGQCASCMYQAPSMTGNDGTATITFTSPTDAVVQLPGGRVTHIQPEAW